ncbi:hypothetical protein C0V82_20070 [Niveispirillum cyanobacteriorum]|uniref:IS110 family transposase n=1 Tax=Niveispirillum cyanobacteriorum TaxID=1612173 RepID=A0A2K9NHQ3_9PROT|nr:hypothetical protein C0V82_20070 [Niveispirillum cyanobacteriorum]
MRDDIDNQIGGLLKTFGILFGKWVGSFMKRAEELISGELNTSPELSRLVETLLKARAEIQGRIRDLDRDLMRQAKASEVCRRFMGVPGVGPVTALSVWAANDDPDRSARSSSVGASEDAAIEVVGYQRLSAPDGFATLAACPLHIFHRRPLVRSDAIYPCQLGRRLG